MNNLIDGTITDFDEGDLVNGTVVKIEHDEVLVDIGFKSEGVVPVRELSIRKDADPSEIVSLGDKIEALVLQKEDKDGRLILSKKRAEYERAWNRIEEKFNSGENVEGEVIEVVKGGLILDIGLLVYFKYTNFFIEIINGLSGRHWLDFQNIFLPVGISFFVFQSISYTADIYRRRIEPLRKWIDYLFYLSFFPQLVAGPIVRAHDIIPQIHTNPLRGTREMFGTGIFLIISGLFK